MTTVANISLNPDSSQGNRLTWAARCQLASRQYSSNKNFIPKSIRGGTEAMTDVNNLHFVKGRGTQMLVPQSSSDPRDPLVHIRLPVSDISPSSGRLGLEQEVEVRCHAHVHSSLLHSRLRSLWRSRPYFPISLNRSIPTWLASFSSRGCTFLAFDFSNSIRYESQTTALHRSGRNRLTLY
jgi:hypothetical protein